MDMIFYKDEISDYEFKFELHPLRIWLAWGERFFGCITTADPVTVDKDKNRELTPHTQAYLAANDGLYKSRGMQIGSLRMSILYLSFKGRKHFKQYMKTERDNYFDAWCAEQYAREAETLAHMQLTQST